MKKFAMAHLLSPSGINKRQHLSMLSVAKCC